MTGKQFVVKWHNMQNYLGLPAVGINVNWHLIDKASRVEVFQSHEAWEKIMEFTPPWFQTPKTFKQLFLTLDPDYKGIAIEEIKNGKMARMIQLGIPDPVFCAFSDASNGFTMLGDGNHRFIIANFLMWMGKNLDRDIRNTKLDVLYLDNFDKVLMPEVIWKDLK